MLYEITITLLFDTQHVYDILLNMRQRLHTYGQNHIWRNPNNFICVGEHKVCRYMPTSDTLEFQVSMQSGNKYVKRLVEVERSEFIKRLMEVC